MKKALLFGIAVLFLATGTAHADGRWTANFRHCAIEPTGVPSDTVPNFTENWILPDDIPEIEAGLKVLKQCKAFWQCVEDRENGKVKHRYFNDKRWRTQFYPPVHRSKVPPWTEN